MLVAGGEPPDVGLMPPVVARAAERLEITSLGPGETLGQVLSKALDPNEQGRLLMAFREQASPRRMSVGTEVTLRFRRGSGLRGVDVVLNPDETVRLTRDRYGWSSTIVRTPTWADTIYASGRIDIGGSLWTAVVGDPALQSLPLQDRGTLIDHLDRTFQWQIDFSRQIQAGDFYRFAFERQVRPDGSMRVGHIVAAELINAGTPFHAIWFDPNDDGKGTYYDLDGKSVRRAFLRKPLEFRRISSRFSSSRFHPILQTWRGHQGVDYAAASGTPIMATADGVVTHAGPLGGLGNAVVIDHPNGFRTRYGHMTAVAGSVHVGTRVRQSQIIGYVGSTGLATGPHLHYELWRSGRAVDPLAIDLPSGDPVPDDVWQRWSSEMQVRLALLERMPAPDGPQFAEATTVPPSPQVDLEDADEDE
jgi:murein DD-endopeptidase MepM/ murein hydrolase activator NlpD